MFKNQVLEHKESGRKVRVLDLDPTTQTVWLFELSDPVALPKPFDLSDVNTALNNKEFVEVAPTAPPVFRKPSETVVADRKLSQK